MSDEERRRTLDEVAPDLKGAYANWKKWESDKNSAKDEFFGLADAAVADRGLAVKMVEVPARDEAHARARVERHYPEWIIQESRKAKFIPTAVTYEVVLIENPSLKPFSYEHDGVKLARQISKGSVMLDDEWLAEEDADLYGQVTYELPWGDVIPIPVDQLPADLVGRLTKYVYNTTPRASLAAPRAIKEEA